ncbi:MAG TPA: heme exporter protein CcmB [Burkholderiales bacterium]|nr:heme exporter protein CcmB [Burkholderiales bacterium]
MGRAFLLVVRRELRLALRRKGDALNVLVFFVVVASLFPFGVGPEPNQLRAMAAGVVWIAALLAAVLSLPRLFAADHADGTLEQMLVAPHPLVEVVLAKTAAHWLLTGLPLTLVSPVIALQYGVPADAQLVLLASLLVGTPVLSLVGAAGAALTLGVRGGGALLALLVLPLFVPVLIFGAGAVGASLIGIKPDAYLSLLGAFLAVSSLVGPWAACAALRVALD